MQRLILPILLASLIITSCKKDEDSQVIDPPTDIISNQFQDGFETEGGVFDDLFPSDASRWWGFQQVNPNNGTNEIGVSNERASEGEWSLKMRSFPSDDILSKIDIERGGLHAEQGQTIILEADYFIESDEILQDLFLMDLECCSCWDPEVPNNQCPGVRLKLGAGNRLEMERGKILGSTLFQLDEPFPLNEWVHVKWVMELSAENDGHNQLFINDIQVLSEAGNNLPNAEEFAAEFAENGIDFTLQEAIYERFQIGATANPTPHELVMYVDDVKIEVN